MQSHPGDGVGQTTNPPGAGWSAFRKGLLSVSLLVLALAWVSTPFWWYAGVITSTPFFGETPSPAEMAEAQRYMGWALLCAFAAPTLGLLLAAFSGRRTGAVLFGIALVLSITAGAVTGVFTREGLRDIQETYFPAQLTPTEETSHHCMELSGGDNECPGG